MANKNETRERPHGLPECASLHPGYDFCDVMARSEDEAIHRAARRRNGLLRFARNDGLDSVAQGCLKFEPPVSSSAKADDPVLQRRR